LTWNVTPFAFVIHPLEPRHAAKRYPLAQYLPDRVIEAFLRKKKPMVMSRITGVRSATGAVTEGWFVACPLTPRMMTTLPLDFVYQRIGECVELAAREGARLVGLGAFTSVVGDGGVTIASRASIAVTTGNSYTVATAIDGTLEACDLVGMRRAEATLAVVGATGSIGRTCAILMAPEFARTVLIGRDLERTEAVASEVDRGVAAIDVARVSEADVIVAVSSAGAEIIQPGMLRSGAVVCDVARPRDVSARVAKERGDVLVIEGGVVAVPGDPDFGLDFGFPPKTAYACMSETMLLALEDRPENFTLGKTVSPEQVNEMRRLASKHGFRLAGFRSFEREVSAETIDSVRRARLGPSAGVR
jgi:predicted amino acid dehydrogenase